MTPKTTALRSFPRTAFLSLLLLVAPGCGDGPAAAPPEILRSDSAGVEIVLTRGADLELPWSFEPLFALGGEDEGPGSFYRVDPSLVGADADGRIYILSGSRVEVFEADGTFLRTMGREGEGPGEIAMGNALAVSPEGGVFVFDFGKRALVRFGPEGSALPQLRFGPVPVQDGSRRLAAAPEGRVATAHSVPVADGERYELRLGTRGVEGDSATLTSFLEPPSEMVRYERCGGGLRQPPVFAPAMVWDADGERVAVSAWTEYRVDVLEEGEVVRSIRRDLPSLEATRELAEAELGEGFTIRFGPAADPCTITPREMVDGRGFHPEAQRALWVALGPDGHLWVTRREERSGGLAERIDVFSPNGAYLGTLPEGTPRPVLLLPDDRVAFAETDDLEIERLHVARIRRPEE